MGQNFYSMDLVEGCNPSLTLGSVSSEFEYKNVCLVNLNMFVLKNRECVLAFLHLKILHYCLSNAV